MKKIKILILSGFGLNCDYETSHSFSLCNGDPKIVHINSLIEKEEKLDDFQILVFGGGFSWGDDHGAGVLQAVKMKNYMNDEILKFIADKKLIIGICNGFQTLVNLGLLPGFNNDYNKRSVALLSNDCGNFLNSWVKLKINKKSKCVFLKDIDNIDLPIRHGEGKFYADDETIKKLNQNNQIALQYAYNEKKLANLKFPHNPNGSLLDIAGICDETSRVFGLMPHPEAFNHISNHPNWTKEKEERRRGKSIEKTLGLKIFQNAIDYFA